MSSELSLTSIDFDERENYYRSFSTTTTQSTVDFHDRVVEQGRTRRSFEQTAVLQPSRVTIINNTKPLKITPMMSKVSGEVGITYEWGNEKSNGASGYASASASDDKGNKAEVKVKVNTDGSGSATVSASHDK